MTAPTQTLFPVENVQRRIIERGGDYAEPNKRGWYVTQCPVTHNHKGGDKHPSLAFKEFVSDVDPDDRTVVFACISGHCTRREIREGFGLTEKQLHSKDTPFSSLYSYRTARTGVPALTLRDFSEAKKLPLDYLIFEAGLEDAICTLHREDGTPYKMEGVLFSYHRRDGQLAERHKLRTALAKTDKQKNIFVWTEGDDEWIPYGLEILIDAIRKGYIIIVEGESDQLTCRYHGFPALGISGASNVETFLEASFLKNIPKVYVIQEKTDQAGMNFPYKVKVHLEKNGYTGSILRVPLKTLTDAKDPSELHQRLWDASKPRDHETFRAEFQRVLDLAKPMDKDTGVPPVDTTAIDKAIEQKDLAQLMDAIPLLATLDAVSFLKYKTRIKEAFGSEVNMNDLTKAINEVKKNLASAGDVVRIDLETIAETFHERYGDTWSYDIEVQTWRCYCGTHWQEPTREEAGKLDIDKIIVKLLHEHDMDVKSNATLDCIHRLAKGKCSRHFSPHARFVNFQNGTLDLESMQLHPHQKSDDLLYCLEYDYRPGAHPHIMAFLVETLCLSEKDENGNKVPDWHAIQAFMAIVGLALMRDTTIPVFGVNYGAPRGGKSTLLRLANAVCGNIARSWSNLEGKYSNFAGDDLFSPELEGKRARYVRKDQRIVCCDELSQDALKQEEMIKNMSAHSGVPMRGMQKNDETNNTWLPKILMSTNNLPHYRDTSGAVKERILYLHTPFVRERHERNPRLLESLMDELPAFAHTCLQAARASLEHWYIPQSAAMKRLANAAESNGNILKAFIEECCILEKGAVIPSSVLYAKFMDYRTDKGHRKDYTQQTMTANIKDMNIGVHNNDGKAFRFEGGKPQKCLFGIRLREEYEYDEDVQTRRVEDDALLLPVLDDFVTGCNEDVTNPVTSPSGSTSQSNTPCNDVTDFSENILNRIDTLLGEEGLRCKVSSKENTNPEKSVTSLHDDVKPPVEPCEACNEVESPPVTSPLQKNAEVIGHLYEWANHTLRTAGVTEKTYQVLWDVTPSRWRHEFVDLGRMVSRLKNMLDDPSTSDVATRYILTHCIAKEEVRYA